MAIASISALSPELTLQKKDTPEKLHDAATQFEALLIGQILKNAQEENPKGEGEDESAASMMDLANDFFARSLASKGGLGLAQVITKGIEHGK